MDKLYDEKTKNEVPKYDNSVGIRATLNNLGISDNKIGYDEGTKTVTIDGKSFMSPKYMDEDAGVSYAPEKEIRQNLVNFYRDTSNPIVKVSDAYVSAAGKYGLTSDGLSYGNGIVTIGGTPLNTLYTDDEGKSWAWQSDVNDLVKKYAENSGVENPNSVLQKYNNEYLTQLNSVIDKLKQRDKFSYNPDEDPVYLAYREKYLTDGNRASKDAMANYSALTGGYANSSAVTAGALANQYYAQQLSNKIPELVQDAYQRYSDEYDADLELADRIISAYNTAYGNAAKANELSRDWYLDAEESNSKRDSEAYERYWSDKLNNQEYDTQEMENYWTNALNQQKMRENDYKIEGYSLDNEQRRTYLEYYSRLLEAELEETYANTYAKYYK